MVVGQITSRIGKSLVQLETRRAVEMAEGVARPGRGVFGSKIGSLLCAAAATGEATSDVFLEWLCVGSLAPKAAVGVTLEEVLEWLFQCIWCAVD